MFSNSPSCGVRRSMELCKVPHHNSNVSCRFLLLFYVWSKCHIFFYPQLYFVCLVNAKPSTHFARILQTVTSRYSNCDYVSAVVEASGLSFRLWFSLPIANLPVAATCSKSSITGFFFSKSLICSTHAPRVAFAVPRIAYTLLTKLQDHIQG